jgi:predicted metal-binding membrane protein
MRALADQRAFLIAAALCFIGSAAVTVAWCASMSSMPGMPMPGGWTMSMAWMCMPGQRWSGATAGFLGMWTMMMIAMMLPALVPMLSRYRRAAGATATARLGRLTLVTGAGYFAAWLLLGAIIYPVGAVLAELAMRNAGVARLAPAAAGLVVIAAGALQAGAWKSRALERCRDRGLCCAAHTGGARGAWRHGLVLGLRCQRCCAPWTAVLLVLGVMDLVAMALVTVAICVERLSRHGERVARAAGILMIAAGIVYLTIR